MPGNKTVKARKRRRASFELTLQSGESIVVDGRLKDKIERILAGARIEAAAYPRYREGIVRTLPE